MQWTYDTYVTQDDEAFEHSDAHLSSCPDAADWLLTKSKLHHQLRHVYSETLGKTC